jgi:DNA polymerase III epsilon subunit-like protein
MIVVDMESSGLDPIKNSLLSIGAVEFENPSNRFYGECSIFEGAHVDPKSLEINGFKAEDIVPGKKQSDQDLLYKFMGWALKTGEVTIAGQNVSTDRDFIRECAKRYRVDWPFAHRTVDLHSVAYAVYMRLGDNMPRINKHSALSLDAIAKFCGLDEEPKPHNGLTGALFETEAFSRLMFGKKLLPEFDRYEIPKKLKSFA